MSSISKSCGLSSSLQEEVMVIKKQGIVSIVGFSSSSQNTKSKSSSAAVSLRRTLSADMSSKTWLSQNGFSSLKRIASSEEFPVYEEEEEEGRGQLEIWNSIQENNKIEKDKKNIDRQFDIWSSMLSNKQDNNNENNVPPPPPYVHPLVKRASSLSGKSLQICTESLGSETGSDGFSSSENGDEHVDGDQQEEELVVEEEEGVKRSEKSGGEQEEEDLLVEKYNNLVSGASATKKSTTRSFPPPLPSLSRGGDRASLHMRPRRDNGRLVLEAVSVPSQNNFHAERQDGRLVLTFINNNEGEIIKSTTSTEEEKNDVGLFPVEIHGGEQEDRTELETEPAAEVVRLTVPKSSGGGVMNVHRLALMMNKSAVLSNRTPSTWSNKFNNDEDQELVNPITPLTQSLPPRPPVARMISMTPAAAAVATATAAARGTGGAGSLNAYEYYWKTKTIPSTKAELISPLGQNQTITKNIIMGNHEKQELLVLRGNKGDNYLLPLSSKGCKEQRRSLLFWEPYCIATS